MITFIFLVVGIWFFFWCLEAVLGGLAAIFSIPVAIGRKGREKKQKEKDRAYAKEHNCEDWFMAKYGEPIDYDDYMKKRK